MTDATPPPTTDSAMYVTMHGQPADLAGLLERGWDAAGQAAELVAGAERLFLVGVGTSYHAALVGEWLFRAVGMDARAVLSFDFATYPDWYPVGGDDAVIVLAHTGTKTFSARSLERSRAAGATVVSVGSLTAEHPGSQLVLRTVERERSAAYTASHTAAMTVLAQIATEVGARRGRPEETTLRSGLEALPGQVAGVLAREAEIEEVANQVRARHAYVAAAGPNAPTALEAVIKAREAAYARIDALPLEQFLHGPLITVTAEDVGILVSAPGANPITVERTAEVAGVLDRIGLWLWLVGQGAPGVGAGAVFELPPVPEALSPILAVVPLQMLAYRVAALKGVHPDTFRRDDPTYKAALALEL
jgi:glutamine---fructose-6-phosphate transaminase (isomerizing)